MQFLVGGLDSKQSVNLGRGDEAADLSSRFPTVGTDHWALIKSPDLMASIRDESGLGTPENVDAIVPSLPVDRPGTFICVGFNYTDYIKEGGYDISDYPVLVMRGHKSIMPRGLR